MFFSNLVKDSSTQPGVGASGPKGYLVQSSMDSLVVSNKTIWSAPAMEKAKSRKAKTVLMIFVRVSSFLFFEDLGMESDLPGQVLRDFWVANSTALGRPNGLFGLFWARGGVSPASVVLSEDQVSGAQWDK